MSPRWLSNTWLVADEPGGHAVIIDTGGPFEPIARAIEELRVEVSHVLCTHHHVDHVVHNDEYRERYGCMVCGHAAERDWFGPLDATIADGEEIESGGLRVRALHIPGHTVGQLGFLINDRHVFTGDTLFRGSVGGTRGAAHTTIDDLRHSILEVLLRLPAITAVYPGHTDETTIGHEAAHNPFVLAWRAGRPGRPRVCTALGAPAELLLRAPDYDGGSKCWVRFVENGREDIVPGSRVTET